MALLPPIIVELQGRAGELTSSLGEAKTKIDELATQGASKFDKLKSSIGPAVTAVGGFATAAGAILTEIAGPAEQAKARLDQAFQNAGFEVAEFRTEIGKTDRQMETFGHTNADTEEALGTLTTALGDPTKALDDMQLVANLAAYKHMSLADAATTVAKAHGGSAKIFKEFGIQVSANADGTKNYDGALTQLGDKLKGQASAAADTFHGKLQALKARITDIAAGLGEKLGPALAIAGPLLMGLSAIVSSSVIPTFLSMAASVIAATWPFVAIAAAIAALVAGVIYAYNHWTWFKDTVDAVAHFFTDTVLPALEAFAGAVVQAFQDMVQWFKDAWDLAKAAWESVGKPIFDVIEQIISTEIGIYETIISGFVDGFKQAWQGIQEAWHSVGEPLFHAIEAVISTEISIYKGAFDGLVAAFKAVGTGFAWVWDNMISPLFGIFGETIGAVKSVIGEIGGAFETAAGVAKAAFEGLVGIVKDAWNGLATAWNSTVGKFSFGVPSWVPLFGGDSFDMPDLPKLAGGGIVTGPTLALIGEAGPEAVIPLNRAGGAGMTVHVTVNAGMGADGGQIGRLIADELTKFARRNPFSLAS